MRCQIQCLDTLHIPCVSDVCIIHRVCAIKIIEDIRCMYTLCIPCGCAAVAVVSAMPNTMPRYRLYTFLRSCIQSIANSCDLYMCVCFFSGFTLHVPCFCAVAAVLSAVSNTMPRYRLYAFLMSCVYSIAKVCALCTPCVPSVCALYMYVLCVCAVAAVVSAVPNRASLIAPFFASSGGS